MPYFHGLIYDHVYTNYRYRFVIPHICQIHHLLWGKSIVRKVTRNECMNHNNHRSVCARRILNEQTACRHGLVYFDCEVDTDGVRLCIPSCQYHSNMNIIWQLFTITTKASWWKNTQLSVCFRFRAHARCSCWCFMEYFMVLMLQYCVLSNSFVNTQL